MKLYSHAIGGVLGGAYVGGLFTGKLVRGAAVFTPIMLLIAITEDKLLNEMRRNLLLDRGIEKYQLEEVSIEEESITK